MWWRVLLAAAVVTCTVTLAHGPQPLDQIKDVLCAMLLNTIQKEDLGAITRRLHVNISEDNGGRSSVQRIKEVTTNKIDTTVTKENIGTSSDDFGQLETNNEPKNFETALSQLKEGNKKIRKVNSSKTENHLRVDQQINCDRVMDYSKGQPTMLSLAHFWANCLNISTPVENYNKVHDIFDNISISIRNKKKRNLTEKQFYTTKLPEEKTVEMNNTYIETLPSVKKIFDEHILNGPGGKKVKSEVQFLQNLNDFYRKASNLRRNSGESFKVYERTNFNDLNKESSKGIHNDESFHTTSNSIDINNIHRKQLSAIDVESQIANKTRYNSLYYGEYEEQNYLNRESLINVTEPAKNYKSGYGNIFYAYNESNAVKTNPDQLEYILKSLFKIPSNSLLDDKNLEGTDSKLDIIVKLREVLKYLENTTAERINSHDNRTNTDAIGRQSNKEKQTPITVLRHNFDTSEPTGQDFKTTSTTIAEIVSVPSVQYVNYLPPINISNGSKFLSKRTPMTIQEVFVTNNHGIDKHNLNRDEIKSDVIDNNNMIPEDNVYYTNNVAMEKLINYQRSEPHKDGIRRQYTYDIPVDKQKSTDLYQPVKNEIITSAEVVSVSSINYVNYLYPTKNINSLGGISYSKTSKSQPHFSNNYIYSREANEHNYYEYEKVKVVAGNRNLHQRHYFYPQTSSNNVDRLKPSLPIKYFTPNMLDKDSGKLKNYAFGGKSLKQIGSMKNIPLSSGAFLSRVGDVLNVDSEDSAQLDLNKSVSITRKPAQNKISDTLAQKYFNRTDRRMNGDVKKIKSVVIGKKPLLPKNVITDIVESVKADILEDLRKELNISAAGSISTAIHTSTSTPMINFSATRNISTPQNIVLDKIMKFLEQMNTSNNGPHVSEKNFQASNKNMKTIEKDVEILTTEKYNVREKKRQKNVFSATRNYNFALQKHKTKHTVHKDIQRQKQYKLKDKIILEPKTFQTNELEISPLSVYVESFISPINQNIIVQPSQNESGKDNRGINMNYYKPQDMKTQTIPNNPFMRNYYTNENPALNNDMRDNLRNYINIRRNDNNDFKNRHDSEEHKDVKYLDDKFLNKVVKDSTALELPSNKDCCDQEYLSQLVYECCSDKVVSRRQKSLIKIEPNNDSRYREFLQSQHTVNAMLERVLAAKTKFRSVESI